MKFEVECISLEGIDWLHQTILNEPGIQMFPYLENIRFVLKRFIGIAFDGPLQSPHFSR